MSFITQGKTNWKFLLIVIILAIIVGGGALWYARRPEKPYQPVEVKKIEEVLKDEEITNGSIFSIEEYGFSIKIPTFYTKREESEKSGLKRIAFSTEKDDKTIVLIIRPPDYAKTTRLSFLNILKVAPEEYTKIVEETLPDVNFISSKNIDKGTCVGKWDYYKENSGKYINSLEITSLNIEEMDLLIFFTYYNKDNELPISKTIDTINCSK
jgi:hypothetical protein